MVYSPGSINISILTVGCYESLVCNLETENEEMKTEWGPSSESQQFKVCHLFNVNKYSIISITIKLINCILIALFGVYMVVYTTAFTLLGRMLAASILARKSVGENLNSFCR